VVHFTKVLLPKNSGLRDRSLKAIKKEGFGNTETIEFRGEDIPKLVDELNSAGSKAIGITGEDLFTEYCLGTQTSLAILKKIPWRGAGMVFGKPTLCLLGYETTKLEGKGTVSCAVNPKFRLLSENYLEKLRRNGLSVEVKEVNGNLERAVEQGIADLCLDVVCTGKAMRECGLSILEKVFESDIVLIGEKQENSFEMKGLANALRESASSNPKSFTRKLLSNKSLLCKKLNEECFELIEAALEGRKSKVVWEAADLLYFVSALLLEQGVSVDAVFNELRRRNNEKRRN